MCVGVMIEQIVIHRIDYPYRNLCSAGAIEVGDRLLAMNSFQRRKLEPDFVDRRNQAAIRVVIVSWHIGDNSKFLSNSVTAGKRGDIRLSSNRCHANQLLRSSGRGRKRNRQFRTRGKWGS